MRIAGIDPDTKQVSIYIMDSDASHNPRDRIRLEARGKRAEDRVEALANVIEDIRLTHIDWAYIEWPVMGVNVKALRDQSIIIGVLRSRLWRVGVQHSMVDNGTWKKAVLGNGHASKEEIAAYAHHILGLGTGLTQDMYDAACIAQFGFKASISGV